MPPKKSRRRGGNSGNNANRARGNPNNPTAATKRDSHSHDSVCAQPVEPSQALLPASGAADENTIVCSVCVEPARDWAIGQCSHVVCGDCAHRMRVLYDRKTCVMCAAALRQVAVVPLRDYRVGMTFEDAVALPGAFQDKQVEMWFLDRARYQQLRNVRGWMCSHTACTSKGAQEAIFANPAQLRAHVRSEHRAMYCQVCFTGKRKFVSEMQLYTLDTDRNFSSRLRGHLRKDHPQCKFCRHYYLDDEKLYSHLQEHHETCAVCERSGRMHEYYVNYEQLEQHYRKQHYVCRDEGCRGVVFATQIELQTHEHSRHRGNSGVARGRALRVNLQQLHGDRDSRRRDMESPRDLQIEQERQAARRRAFLSSNVVFSGALNFEDATFPAPLDEAGGSSQAPSSSEATSSFSTSASFPSASNSSVRVPRAPDDGHFHPLDLPRDSNEMQARNAILVRSMRSLLDPAAYEQFRMASGQFHNGEISSDEYYDAVTDAFGVRTAIRDILPELVALLPTPLLREPLLRTCLARTDTKASNVSYLGPPSADDGSNPVQSGSGRAQDEQFPTLNGAPVPQRTIPASVRRFGAPGPEEFPRLGRVNRPQGGAASSALPGPLASRQSATRPFAPSGPASVSRPPSARPPKTAASVLRQAPTIQARQQVSVTAGGMQTANTGAQLPASAFPSLSSVAGASTASPVHDQNITVSNGSSSGVPPADVSMRVGAVWGGVAARAHNNRGGKKRGPGRGQGRVPASPPKRVLLGSSDFPEMRTGSASDNVGTASDPQAAQGNTRRAVVIDVVEIAKSRRKAMQNSSLPRVGGSGYGFAWDRKKVQQKKRQIKSDAEQSLTSQTTKRAGSSMTPMSLEGQSSNSNANTSAALESRQEDDTDLSSRLEDVDIEDEASQTQQMATQGEEPFDPYSYLKNDSTEDDVVASFLGKRK